MKRREACELLGCNLYELSIKLNISDSAVAQWGDERDIPKLREYEVRELSRISKLESASNLAMSSALENIQK